MNDQRTFLQAVHTIPIELPPMRPVGADLDGFFDEDALTEADALDSAVDVELCRLPDGRYTMGVPVQPEVGAVLLSLGEALDLLRASLLDGDGVTVNADRVPGAETAVRQPEQRQ